jgi:hypothetical protein
LNEVLLFKGSPGSASPHATLAMVILVVCALYFVLSHSAKRLAQIQHLKDLWGEFTSRPIATFRHQTAVSRLARLPLEETDFFKVLSFFEGLAILEKRGYLSATGIREIFSPWIFPYYKELLMCSQDLRNFDLKRYPNLQVLHRLLETMELKKNKNWTATLPQEIPPFWQAEATSTMNSSSSVEEPRTLG